MSIRVRVVVVSHSYYTNQDISAAIDLKFGDRVVITEFFRDTHFYSAIDEADVIIGNGLCKTKGSGGKFISINFPEGRRQANMKGIPYISFAKRFAVVFNLVARSIKFSTDFDLDKKVRRARTTRVVKELEAIVSEMEEKSIDSVAGSAMT